jgi:DNA-binding PadR family transcriptional regulator
MTNLSRETMTPAPGPTLPLLQPVFHILLALARDDLHGLGIADEVERVSAGSIELGPGTLYRSLKEMVQQGVIREVASPPDADPRRKYYSATDMGRSLMAAEVTRLARIVEAARERDVLPETT